MKNILILLQISHCYFFASGQNNNHDKTDKAKNNPFFIETIFGYRYQNKDLPDTKLGQYNYHTLGKTESNYSSSCFQFWDTLKIFIDDLV